MTDKLTGGCACGAIRYEAKNDIEFSFQCHCRKCQRATGGGHASAFAVAASNVVFKGTVTEYAQGSDVGATTYSGFCATCGSPISSRTERFAERVYIHAATLDMPSVFYPTMSVFSHAAQPWDRVNPDLEKAPE